MFPEPQVMGKTANWTDVQKTFNDTFHEKGKPKLSFLERLVVHKVL